MGDHVGIGYYMDSCLECNFCKSDEEPLCEKGTKLNTLDFRQWLKNDNFVSLYKSI